MVRNNKAPHDVWVRQQIRQYSRVKPRYERCAEALELVLEKASERHAPQAIVQARAKAIASFAEKIQRKKKYTNPVRQFTDLCGARIITHTPEEVNSICSFIEEHFDIDWDNCINAIEHLKPSEFGYRSLHYIVSFRRGVFPTHDVDIKIPADLLPDDDCPMKAEIQVRTILEHAWADIVHDRSYKSAFKVPDKWQREIAVMAAILEDAGNAVERIIEGLELYAANYGNVLSEEEARNEIRKLEIVLQYDRQNAKLAHRIGRLAITIGDWDKAIETLSNYVDSGYLPLLRDLGVATCQKYKGKKTLRNYRQGQRYLEKAAAPEHKDADAIASLAGTWKGIDENKARDLYRRAYEVDPSDPYPLINYLVEEIVHHRSTSIVSIMHPAIEAAIGRSRAQADVGMNLPWAWFNMGLFRLVLGQPYQSLAAYAKAVQLSSASFMIETSLNSLNRFSVVRDKPAGYQWMRRLLAVGLIAHLTRRQRKAKEEMDAMRLEAKHVKTASEDLEKEGANREDRDEAARKVEAVKEALGKARETRTKVKRELARARSKYLIQSRWATPNKESIRGHVVIVAGGCEARIERKMKSYRSLLLEGFKDFKGRVISGGFTSGIPRLIGEVAKEFPDSIHAIGYVPETLPSGVKRDERYIEIRTTRDKEFSPLEPLQCWIDMIASGIDPADVKMLGINGGKIAAAEYRLALAFGARVALLQESGGEAAKLEADTDWGGSDNLVSLPADPMTAPGLAGEGPT